MNKKKRKYNHMQTERGIDNIASEIPSVIVRAAKELEEVNENELKLASSLFQRLLDECKKPEMNGNKENNLLLARASIRAIQKGTMPLWRFVCMPRIGMVAKDSMFERWTCEIGDTRYDTLSPALSRDFNIIELVRRHEITPNLYYVLDDWEVPWLRTESDFNKLFKDEKEKALQNLFSIRTQTKDWITGTTKAFNNVPNQILFFSELIDYQSFCDLMDAPRLEATEAYQGTFEQEYQFIKKADFFMNDFERRRAAMRRIIQYATEGSILANTSLGQGIYLNSEYPVQVVWKKLTLFAELPTLFYVTDKDVKNI